MPLLLLLLLLLPPYLLLLLLPLQVLRLLLPHPSGRNGWLLRDGGQRGRDILLPPQVLLTLNILLLLLLPDLPRRPILPVARRRLGP